jgi:hypothetical protein
VVPSSATDFAFFALHFAHRFRCAAAMRFRAWADIVGRRLVTAPSTASLTPATALLTADMYGLAAVERLCRKSGKA